MLHGETNTVSVGAHLANHVVLCVCVCVTDVVMDSCGLYSAASLVTAERESRETLDTVAGPSQ